MRDQDLFHRINALKEQVAQIQDSLSKAPQAYGDGEYCACDKEGHCAHHAAVYYQLDEAYRFLHHAATQLRFPNGIGDRPAWK